MAWSCLPEQHVQSHSVVMLGLLVHESVIAVMVIAEALLGALGLFGPAAEAPEKQIIVCLEAKTAGESSASYDEC